VRQAHLAGTWNVSAADKSGIGDGVMGRTKRPPGDQGLFFNRTVFA
jgi:hypothetical protein